MGCRLEDKLLEQDENERRWMHALQGISVWTLSTMCRALGQHRFSGSALWEWGSGDATWVLTLVKGLLGFQSRATGELGIIPVPDEIADLEVTMLSAVLHLASPD